jgi:hypothetical protein
MRCHNDLEREETTPKRRAFCLRVIDASREVGAETALGT